MATSGNPDTSIVGSFKPSFITKPSYGTFRINATTYCPCIKESSTRHMKARVACKVTVHHHRLETFGNSISEYRIGYNINSLSLFGFVNPPLSFSKLSFWLSSEGFRPTYVIFPKRVFSVKTMPKSDSLKCYFFNKQRKRFKLDNKSSGQIVNRGSANSQTVPHKIVNTVNSSNVLARQGQKGEKSIGSLPSSSAVENKLESQTETQQKQRARNGKKKEEPSDAQSSSESVSTSSRKVKNPNDFSPQVSEKSSSESVIAPKKRASISRKREKPLQPDDLQPTLSDVQKPKEVLMQAHSSDKSPQQPKCRTAKASKSKLKPLYPPVGKSVVVVESQTKAEVIQHYLGDMYEVLPSYGHVRDLAARFGSVRPDDDFKMVWEVPTSAWPHLESMKVALSGADNLVLASDPDHEGEAIAWHIIEMLKQQDALHKDITVARVTFQEITELAIKRALQTPRDIDVNLVHAYLARRAIDYLIGFNISPLLWRKLPGCKSIGRVQSAALGLICDREMEIEGFKPQEYWSLEATFSKNGASFSSNCLIPSYLFRFGQLKLDQFSIGSETEAKIIEQFVDASNFTVTSSKRIKVNRNSPSPYITSTLQQDAANNLNFTASHTMKLAQKLYEGIELSDGKALGLITYMRTDDLHISDEAANGICSFITERYGVDYAAKSPHNFCKKVKKSQEAQEAIRPTDIRRLPSMLVDAVDEDSLKLYTLIWVRTMACHMETSVVDQIQLDIGNDVGSISFQASCSIVSFRGFRLVYEDGETNAIRDTETEVFCGDELYKFLSNLKQGDQLILENMEVKQHHSQPPPRYSEASLVKQLEKLGIGRPSTYASTISVLLDRNYVTAKSGVLYPEFRGRMVSAFVSHFFNEVTNYSFTAYMETELDNVSANLTEWKGLLKDYWSKFRIYCERVDKVHIHQVEKILEMTLGNFLFSSLPNADRICPSCLEGTLMFKVSRFRAGYFIGCDQHPKCKFIAKTLYGEEEDDEAPQNENLVVPPKLLGTHPTSGEKVLLKAGPYGSYVQLGEDRKGHMPKRASISQIKDVKSFTLEDALDLFRYPVSLGNHPVDGLPVAIKISKAGFTIRHRRYIADVPKNLPPNDITMEKAIELLSGPNVRKYGR